MGDKKKPPPVYEVEFIPIERRLNDRRKPGEAPPAGAERRNLGRRKSDQLAPEAPVADERTKKK